MRRALVTGSTGFLGANLVEALNRHGIPVRAFHRKTSRLDALEGLEYEEAIGDVLDTQSLMDAMEGCDVVFHVAAVADYWRRGPEWLYKINVEGTRNVLEAAIRMRISRVVYTSSVAALGVPERGTLGNENMQFNIPPKWFPYGHSKHLAELEVQKAIVRGLDAVIVNPGVIIGPRDINRISGSILIQAARQGIPVYTDGGVNVIAVQDVAEGEIAAAERGRKGERYILGNENLTHLEMFLMVCDIVGCKPPAFKLPRWLLRGIGKLLVAANVDAKNLLPIDRSQMLLSTEYLFFDNTKARTELGLPHTPVKEAFLQTYKWYKSQNVI